MRSEYNMNEFRTREDIRLIREIMGYSQAELAKELDVSYVTLSRWESGATGIAAENMEKIYSFAYSTGIFISRIKEQLYREETGSGRVLLFHGAKSSIDGPVSADKARANNDFGRGFYMGESFRQAGLFVSNFPDSSVYILEFDTHGLDKAEYRVDKDWLLTMAAFRGRLRKRFSRDVIGDICTRAEQADYIIAPIADNRMYQIIDSFIDGEITDEQCVHALAATDLGLQYIARTDRAISRIRLLERCYLCSEEKRHYITQRTDDLRSSEDKVRAARIRYRGTGQYIDEILSEES